MERMTTTVRNRMKKWREREYVEYYFHMGNKELIGEYKECESKWTNGFEMEIL